MTLNELEIIQEKEFNPEAEKKTVVDAYTIEERGGIHPYVFTMALAGDGFTRWGYNSAQRDKQLREFWPTEPWLAGVVYGVSVRNASFAWEIMGANPEAIRPKNTINAVTSMLNSADHGNGWTEFVTKICTDMYTQDNGAFIELVRKTSREDSPVIGINHLDAARCLRTGDPDWPVIYTTRWGKEIPLKRWQVQTIEEFPSPIEEMRGIQYSAVTRCLMAAQVLKDIAVYKHEKVAGQFTRSIHVVSNVTQNNIKDATALAAEQNLNKGLYRYSQPVIVTGIDPTHPLSHIQIDLATLPDAFSEEETLKWYVAVLALTFGVDYQEIAPLMTGNLGSSSQSETLHLKTQGKGPALFISKIEHVFNNNGILPSNVKLQFKEQDLRTETEKANARFTRSKDRSLRVKSGELDAKASRQLAVEDGDLPLWMMNEIEKRAEAQPQETKPVDQGSSEMNLGADQIASGTTSHDERKEITNENINELRRAISENPLDFLRRRFNGKVSK